MIAIIITYNSLLPLLFQLLYSLAFDVTTFYFPGFYYTAYAVIGINGSACTAELEVGCAIFFFYFSMNYVSNRPSSDFIVFPSSACLLDPVPTPNTSLYKPMLLRKNTRNSVRIDAISGPTWTSGHVPVICVRLTAIAP